MEREEIERVEQELDEILKLVQPEKTLVQEQAAEEEACSRGEEDFFVTEDNARKRDEQEGPGEGDMPEAETPEEKMQEEDMPDTEIPGEDVSERDTQENMGKRETPEEAQNEELLRKTARKGLRLLKASDGLAAAFFVPVIIMIIIFAQRGIFPFGEECFLRTDMYHQYAPFFSEFQHKLTRGGSLLYSWDIGMGVNFSALYAYYLASPMNWLIVLCPKPFIIEFMTILIVLKTGLSGLSFAWYLGRHSGRQTFGAGFFGIFYALSGYMAAYSWNIMWLDCILLLPLILLGLERLVWEKKGFLYCISLGLSILSNYYISIMICIFMVIYAIALAILHPPKGIRAFAGAVVRFVFYSLLAGGLAAIAILPALSALKATASGNFDFPKTISSYFPIFDMIARHMGNVGSEIGLDHWPNLYCGTPVFLLLPLFWGSKKISVREKAVYSGMLLLFYASFSINALNFIWHGFHYPNSLPCRQSFIYIALVLVMCHRAYACLEDVPWRQLSFSFGGAVIFVLLAEKLVNNPEQYHFSVFYLALILLALYGGMMYLYRRGRWNADGILLSVLAIVSVEAAVNLSVTSIPTTSRTSYVQDNEDVESLTGNIQDDNLFYRVEKGDRKTKNDGAWMNFPSVSLFSSTANAALSDFFEKLGCESSTNAYSITGSTPLADSLFSVKYALYPDQRPASSLQTQIDRRGNTWLYENLYTLPVAFLMPENVEENWITDFGNPASVQNDLCSVLGVENVLIWNESQTEGKRMSFVAEETGDYYIYVTNKKVKEVTAVIGEHTQVFDNADRGYFLELGYVLKGQQVDLTAEDQGSPTLQAEVWRFNPEGLKAVYEAMNNSPITVTEWTDTSLSGTITSDRYGVLFTSIPYEKGWSVWVDGAETAARPIFDTFLAVDIGPGEHTLRFSYEPEGWSEGIQTTAASAAVLAVLAGISFLRKKRMADRDGRQKAAKKRKRRYRP